MDSAKENSLMCAWPVWHKKIVCLPSGGADSALLLVLLSRACQKAGTHLVAIHINTELSPDEDLELAQSFAQKMNVAFEALHLNEWTNPAIVANSRDRCYHCKKLLFSTLKDFAKERGIENVIDGTNHDDLGQYRPGLKAIKELGIFSPLAYSGVTKTEVRSLLEELGLEVAHRPSSRVWQLVFPTAEPSIVTGCKKLIRQNVLLKTGAFLMSAFVFMSQRLALRWIKTMLLVFLKTVKSSPVPWNH